MSGLELNKFLASILLASLIAMISGFVANVLYKPDLNPKQRGHSVIVIDSLENDVAKPEAEIKFDIPTLMKNANANAGKELAKKCLSCHSLDKDGPNKIGPYLWNIAGADKGRITTYKYSDALKAVAGKWDDESLFLFLHKPLKFIPGTKMTFIGLAKPEDVANIVMFLKTFVTDNPLK
jgi:cytochrome c